MAKKFLENKVKYRLTDKGEFIIENYNYAKPMANFFPAIAGKYGIPMWLFYVNRGQAINSFGTDGKDSAILEFQPANKAWQQTALLGFRTFIKLCDKNKDCFYEPFHNGISSLTIDLGSVQPVDMAALIPARLFYASTTATPFGVPQRFRILGARDELFTATRGAGAYLDRRRLRVATQDRLTHCLIGTGFPYREDQDLEKYLKIFAEMSRQCAGLRRPGAASLDLAYVAAGRYDGFFESDLKPWDMAAGALLITESGGLVGNYRGEEGFLQSGEVMAANPRIFAQMVQNLSKYSAS